MKREKSSILRWKQTLAITRDTRQIEKEIKKIRAFNYKQDVCVFNVSLMLYLMALKKLIKLCLPHEFLFKALD